MPIVQLGWAPQDSEASRTMFTAISSHVDLKTFTR